MIFRTLLFTSTILLAAETSQQPISELAIFNRCYAHFTQNALPLSHPLRAEIAAGKISATNILRKIFPI